MNTNHPSRIQRGFTLIELVIVLAVLGALAAIAVPQLTGLQEEARLNGTATTVSSELGNAFAKALAEGNADTTPWNSSSVCGDVDDTNAPALSGYTLDANADGVTVTVPYLSGDTVQSQDCNLVSE